ncbi:MAG: lipoprotein-releasing ABC transporter permease subunit [Candidatus Eiseniibacteriota bacterium]|nr:MAG: lipoprotein-releasing ABC transporter permease subunit [Candidatus Eisenbacteria bacterium]
MKFELFVARRYLRAKRRVSFISLISAISVGGVLVGVAALTIVLSVMNGFEDEVQRRIVGANAHVVVLSHGDSGLRADEEFLRRVEGVPGVEAVAPFVYSKGMISAGGFSDGVVIKGIDLPREKLVTEVHQNISPVIESIDLPDGRSGIVLGHYLANSLGVSAGDEVVLTSPLEGSPTIFGMIPRVKKFEVVGIFTSGMYDYDSSFGYISIRAAQEFLGRPENVTGVEVRVHDMYKAPGVADDIITALGGFPFTASSWIELNRNLFSWMKTEKIVMFIILMLIVAVAAFNIISTLIMVVMEKRRDIGILKSMGATSSSVMRIFMAEGVAVGLIGTVLGSLTGFVGCFFLQKYKFISLPGDVYFIDRLPVKMEAGDFLLVALAAVGVCFAATLYPSWKASRLVPVEAIRHE